MSRFNLLNWLSLVFAATLVTISFVFAYVMLAPVDVLKQWQVHVDEKAYHPGDDVVLHVNYQKVREATGTSYRYLECRTPRGSLERYPISQAEANRGSGIGSADVVVKLPSRVPNLPAQCRIALAVEYTIYTFRIHPEHAESNYFEVKE